MARKRIGIIGSTGSIGKQALDVIRLNRDIYEVTLLSCNSSIPLLKKQAEEFQPKYVCSTGEQSDGILSGDEIINIIRSGDIDLLLLAAVGAAGTVYAYEAVDAGIDLALANKESIVATGKILLKRSKETGSMIIPVDSEHSAIFQSLAGHRKEDVDKIVLTASGGAFRNTPADALEFVGVSEALSHPNWSMGSKITVDSATMMNKGLELIEARFLFDVEPDKLDVVIHPQSIVHSYVTYVDGSMIAQLGDPNMRTPIAYAMAYPERTPSGVKPLNLAQVGALTFFEPDFDKYRCLEIARVILKMDKSSSMIVMNAANEIAVEKFINGDIKFVDIPAVIENTLEKYEPAEPETVSDVLVIDKRTREIVLNEI